MWRPKASLIVNHLCERCGLSFGGMFARVVSYLFLIIVLPACSLIPVSQNDRLSPTNQVQITFELAPEPVETEEVTPDLLDFPADDSVVLIWHSLADDTLLGFYALVAQFQTRHPNTRVMLQYIPFDDLHEQYVRAVSAGNGPSLLLGPGIWGAGLYDSDVVLDLSSKIPVRLLSEINTPSLESVTYEDALVAVPYRIEGVVLYRNSAVLPHASQSFEDFSSAVHEVTGGSKVGAYLDRGDIYGLAQITACGGNLINENKNPDFNNDAGICWVELLQSFKDIGPVTFNTDDDLDQFRSGRVGAIFDGTWHMDLIIESLGENLVIDPWPAYRNSHLSGFVWAESIFVNPNLNQDAQAGAIRFASFLLSEGAQSELADLNFIPAVRSTEVQNPLIAQMMVALQDGTAFPSDPLMDHYLAALNEALKDVFVNQVTPVAALNEAFNQIVGEIELHSDD